MLAKNTKLEEMLNKVVEIPANRRYWLIRTDGGIHYDDFKEGNIISIGWNEFSEKSFFTDEKASNNHKLKIQRRYPNKQPSRIYNQIRRFIFDLNIGDVVMIPDENSKNISFGVIESDYYRKDDVTDNTFIKSRDVKWVNVIKRKELDPYLFRMMQARQTVNNADNYAHYIDRSMYSLFNKRDRCYLNIAIGRKGNLPAYDLSRYLESVLQVVELTNDIATKEYHNNYSIEDIDIKVNVQSRGWSLLSGVKDLIAKFAVVSNAALYTEIDELTSDELTRDRRTKIQQIKQGMKQANAELPIDLRE